ncbi:hypothetical protein PF004_g27445 [Phytophthora fragariae]|uniref:Uncharacterized protein n=1 Tax=Phytophthora fragariae TaxID=53985 RepID=A0A6G0MLM6_9STRA|nr:hypothetical protein PF004_g27445 [Phytophthora fragariae]
MSNAILIDSVQLAKYDREVAVENANDLRYNWACENKRAKELKVKLDSYAACTALTPLSGNATVIT